MSPTIEEQEAFFAKFGYQMCNADFVNYLIDQAVDGTHDIEIRTINLEDAVHSTDFTVDAHYSFSKRNNALFFSSGDLDELCLAVEKAFSPLYTHQDHGQGIMTITSHPRDKDPHGDEFGYSNDDDGIRRGYLIGKGIITAVTGEELKELEGDNFGIGLMAYRDAWPYEATFFSDIVLKSLS